MHTHSRNSKEPTLCGQAHLDLEHAGPSRGPNVMSRKQSLTDYRCAIVHLLFRSEIRMTPYDSSIHHCVRRIRVFVDCVHFDEGVIN